MDTGEIKNYYDRNTRRFLNNKNDISLQSIHRAVWAPSIHGKQDALRYTDTLLLSHLSHAVPGALLDLGCGVGSSMYFLAGKLDREIRGITLSSVQYSIGNSMLEKSDFAGRVRIIRGDFTDRRSFEEVPPCGGVYAVESLVHCADTRSVFEAVRPKLNSGALMILVDDFLVRLPEKGTKDERLLQDFRENWHAYGLKSPSEIISLAGDSRFTLEEEIELTPWTLRTDIAKLSALAGASIARFFPNKSSYLQNIVGGAALQKLTKRKVTGYFLLVFRYHG